MAVSLTVLSLLASACGAGGQGAPRTMTGSLVIATFNPFSGVDATFGPEEAAGCFAAIRLINQAGGTLGHLLECRNVDTQGDPTAGTTALQGLLATTPNLVAILGPSSDEALPTVPIIDRAHVPMFVDAGQAVYDRSTYQYLWRITPPDDAAGYALAIWAHLQGYRRGAALFGSDLSSQAFGPTLLKGFKQLGGTIVINQTLMTGKSSYAAEVDGLIQARRRHFHGGRRAVRCCLPLGARQATSGHPDHWHPADPAAGLAPRRFPVDWQPDAGSFLGGGSALCRTAGPAMGDFQRLVAGGQLRSSEPRTVEQRSLHDGQL